MTKQNLPVEVHDRPGKQPVLVTPSQEEYCCGYCSHVRTKAQGLVTGAK